MMTRLKALLKSLRGRRRNAALLIAGLLVLATPSAFNVLTNSIVFSGVSPADSQTLPVSADTLKPKGCDGITVTHIQEGSGTVTGTSANDLLLATTPAGTTLEGGAGSDCLIIGDGGTLDGGGPDGSDPDTDICIGGPTTVFIRCETTLMN